MLRPVLDRVYTGDIQALEPELERLATRIHDSPLDGQQLRVLRLNLLSVELRARMDVSAVPPTPWQLAAIFGMMQHRSPDLICDLLITRELLLWRLIADNHGLRSLSGSELATLLGRLEGLTHDRQLWHVLAMWAFLHRDRELLGRAYELFLLHPGTSLNQVLWQRVNLMHLLLAGRARCCDVLETIRVLSVHPQVEEFRRLILPECIRCGIADVNVQRLLDERIEELRSSGYAWRGNEARTKSLRTRTV